MTIILKERKNTPCPLSQGVAGVECTFIMALGTSRIRWCPNNGERMTPFLATAVLWGRGGRVSAHILGQKRATAVVVAYTDTGDVCATTTPTQQLSISQCGFMIGARLNPAPFFYILTVD